MSVLFKDLAVKNANKQAKLVDKLTEATPILNGIPMQPASGGLSHVFEDLQNIVGGTFVDLNETLTTVSSDSELGQVDLKMIGGEMFVSEDTAIKMGGKDSYFAMKFPPILRKTGMTVETSMVESLRQYAIANSNTVTGGGSGDINSSIVAVTWVEGEIQGLYDPDFYKNGIFDIKDLSGGNLYKEPTSKKNGYGRQFKSALGLLMANPNYVSAYVNITAATGITATKMDEVLDKCRRGNGTTVLYMPPSLLNIQVKKLKNDRVHLVDADTNVFKSIYMWDDVPIITSYNLPFMTEATVS